MVGFLAADKGQRYKTMTMPLSLLERYQPMQAPLSTKERPIRQTKRHVPNHFTERANMRPQWTERHWLLTILRHKSQKAELMWKTKAQLKTQQSLEVASSSKGWQRDLWRAVAGDVVVSEAEPSGEVYAWQPQTSLTIKHLQFTIQL